MTTHEVSLDSEFFVQIPNAVLFDTRLLARHVRLYAVLVHFAGAKDVCWPSQQTLAELVGCTERHIRNLIGRLVEVGVISYKRGTYGKPNVYRLLVRVIHKEPEVIHNGASADPIRNSGKTPIRKRSAAESYSLNNNHGWRGYNPYRNSKEAGAMDYIRRHKHAK
jgi:hypothetical protein